MSEIHIGFSFADGRGQTCDVCRSYRLMSEFPDNLTGDSWFDTFRTCLACRSEAEQGAPVWNVTLMGLGDNDSAWEYWERSVPDGVALVNRLLRRTKDRVVLEEHCSLWHVDVRWKGWLPGLERRRRRDWEYVYEVTAQRVPPRFAVTEAAS